VKGGRGETTGIKGLRRSLRGIRRACPRVIVSCRIVRVRAVFSGVSASGMEDGTEVGVGRPRNTKKGAREWQQNEARGGARSQVGGRSIRGGHALRDVRSLIFQRN